MKLGLLIGILLFAFLNLQGQSLAGIYDSTIHYKTRFTPPLLISSENDSNNSKSFDANNDGIIDFEIVTYSGSFGDFADVTYGKWSYIEAYENGSFSIGSNYGSHTEPYEFHYADTLNINNSILEYVPLNFVMTIAFRLQSPPEDDNTWLNNPNFMGFRIVNTSNDTLYGWIKASVLDYDSLYVHEIVCESLNPEINIVTSIQNNKNDDSISFFPNPANETLFFKYKQGHQVNKVQIFNLDGTLVLEKSKDLDALNISNLQQGAYIIIVKNKSEDLLHRGQFIKY